MKTLLRKTNTSDKTAIKNAFLKACTPEKVSNIDTVLMVDKALYCIKCNSYKTNPNLCSFCKS